MVATPGEFRNQATAGELSQDLGGAINLRKFYSGGLRFKNIEPVPQSGFRQMPGSRRRSPGRKPLVTVTPATSTTYPGPHAAEATCWEATLSGATSIVAVEIVSYSATATSSIQLQVQNAGGGWVNFGRAYTAGPLVRTRFIAMAPGAGVTATELRIRITPTASATFTVSSVTLLTESGTAVAPKFKKLKVSSSVKYQLVASAGIVDVFQGGAFIGAAYVPALTSDLVAGLNFYAEANTVGLFHPDLKSIRIFRESDDVWTVDDWPYDGLPTADLGGTYTKIADKWSIFVKWVGNSVPAFQIVVDGEQTAAIEVNPDVENANWASLASALQTELQGLPSLGAGCTVSQAVKFEGGSDYREFIITFGGDFAGVEHEVSMQVTGTSTVSALPSHIQIGETLYEDLVSVTRGWFAGAELVQDRLCYFAPKARGGSITLSETAEYFRLNTKRLPDTAAILAAIRSQTAETIRRVIDSKYLVIMTDEAQYFVPNRAISRNEPMNFVNCGYEGIKAGTSVVEIGGRIYFVAAEDDIVYSMAYDDVSTSFQSEPESLLSSHLIDDIVGTARQRGSRKMNAHRFWMLRSDGRLIFETIIQREDIRGFAEWVSAGGDPVKRIGHDADNELWLAVDRGGTLQIETLEEDLWFQSAVDVTADSSGVCSGLDYLEGRTVWMVSEGFVEGPFTVAGGQIDAGSDYASKPCTVGLWQAPVYESMPYYRIVGETQIIKRPGRIHTVDAQVIDTTSLAIGANGTAPVDVALLLPTDPVDTPMPAKTGKFTVDGLDGEADGTTVVITQVRPGSLQIRDLTIGAKL